MESIWNDIKQRAAINDTHAHTIHLKVLDSVVSKYHTNQNQQCFIAPSNVSEASASCDRLCHKLPACALNLMVDFLQLKRLAEHRKKARSCPREWLEQQLQPLNG